MGDTLNVVIDRLNSLLTQRQDLPSSDVLVDKVRFRISRKTLPMLNSGRDAPASSPNLVVILLEVFPRLKVLQRDYCVPSVGDIRVVPNQTPVSLAVTAVLAARADLAEPP